MEFILYPEDSWATKETIAAMLHDKTVSIVGFEPTYERPLTPPALPIKLSRHTNIG